MKQILLSLVALLCGSTMVMAQDADAGIEATWTLITDQFDATQLDSNNQIVIPMTTIEQYEQICIVTTVDITKGYNDYGAILCDGGWGTEYGGGNFACDNTETTVTLVLAVEDLVSAISIDNLIYVVWDNVSAAAIYGYSVVESGNDAPQWKVASQSWNGSWGGSWTGVSSATGVLELETTVADIMAADGVEELGGINFQIWNVNGYEGTEISWTFTVTSVDGNVVLEDSGTGVIGAEGYEVNEYNAISVKEYNTTICWGEYSFATSDIVKATVTVIGDVVYNDNTAIAEIKSDVEAVEIARYNLVGQKLSGAEKGINIIVYSDGSSKKVLVK